MSRLEFFDTLHKCYAPYCYILFFKGTPLENSDTKGGPLEKSSRKINQIFLNVNSSVGTRDIYFVYVCKVYNIYAENQKILGETPLKGS